MTTAPAGESRPSTADCWALGRKVRLAFINGMIALLLVLMVLQGMPLNMNAVVVKARYVADWLGIGHGGWNMFAPEPDRQNHRLTAEVMADDSYVLVTWSSPYWPELSPLTRFRMHRWSEYFDHVWMNDNSACWPVLARYVANTAKIPYEGDDNRPRQVRLIRESHILPEPTGSRWPKPQPPAEYNDSWILSIEPLP
jgi:hypothetical protein